jgi:hypothetical protein
MTFNSIFEDICINIYLVCINLAATSCTCINYAL